MNLAKKQQNIIINLVKTNRDWQGFVKNQYINRSNFLYDIAKKIEIIFSFTELKKLNKQIYEINLNLTNNKAITKINAKFRQKNQPTNIIAFPFLSHQNIASKGIVSTVSQFGQYIFLGELFLSYQVIKLEASEHNKTFVNHFYHLITHGILHLLGYDHINDDDAKIMEDLEIKILNYLGIENPYL